MARRILDKKRVAHLKWELENTIFHSLTRLAKKYDMHRTMVSKIQHGHSWSEIKPIEPSYTADLVIKERYE